MQDREVYTSTYIMKLEPEALWLWKNSPKNQNWRFFDFQSLWNPGPRDYLENYITAQDGS
jgi:hypothetical protein